MPFRQITKYKRKGVVPAYSETKNDAPKKQEEAAPEKKIMPKKNKAKMDEKVNKAEEIMQNMKEVGNVKVLKKDKGLIERTESSKIVLTEDNRQVLND